MSTITHDFDMAKTSKKGFDVPQGFPIPRNKSVILEIIHEEQKTNSGVIVGVSSSKNNIARIMAVGEGCDDLKPGMKVMYNIHEDRTIRFEENHYLIMHETSVFCILPEKAILIPEARNLKEEKRQDWLAKEQKRLNENYKREQNKADEILERKKKIFNKKK